MQRAPIGAIRGACHRAALRADPLAIAPYTLYQSLKMFLAK
jgi:hypothetical protein